MEQLPTVADCPAEMVAAVAADASHDADLVGLFLHYLGLRRTPEKPLAVPFGFLLHLRAVLRLVLWEAEGLFYHRTTGLPDAAGAIRDAFMSLVNPNADPTPLWQTVLRISVERFAWHGRRDLDADVALGDLIDDAALDALAEHLWAFRHAGTATGSPKP